MEISGLARERSLVQLGSSTPPPNPVLPPPGRNSLLPDSDRMMCALPPVLPRDSVMYPCREPGNMSPFITLRVQSCVRTGSDDVSPLITAECCRLIYLSLCAACKWPFVLFRSILFLVVRRVKLRCTKFFSIENLNTTHRYKNILQ